MAHDNSIPRFMAYLSLFTFFMLMLVTADNFVQMFFGWEGVGLCSYLLIGFWYDRPAPTPRRSRPSSSTASAISASRSASSPSTCCSARCISTRSSTPRPNFAHTHLHLPRLAGRRADRHLHPAVRRRDGQIGADRPAHLAAGRDGRPDAGLGADPCRDHGDGRRLHGGAAVAAVRIRADRARLSSCVIGGTTAFFAATHRHGAERHQARHRLFDLQPARLHVLRRRRLGAIRRRSSI